jgi:hypothetical protein
MATLDKIFAFYDSRQARLLEAQKTNKFARGIT